MRGLALSDSLDKAVLSARQSEALGVGAFGHVLIDEQDGRVGLGRSLCRACGVRAVIEVHMGARKVEANRFER